MPGEVSLRPALPTFVAWRMSWQTVMISIRFLLRRPCDSHREGCDFHSASFTISRLREYKSARPKQLPRWRNW